MDEENEFKEVRKEYEYKVHLYGINQIKWNPDGNMIASAGNDCNINLVDVHSVRNL
jgi:hypothetical protein